MPIGLTAAARTAPAFVIVGAHDTFLPTSSLCRATEHRLGSGLRVIGDAGHLVLDEAVDRVTPVVSEALGAR